MQKGRLEKRLFTLPEAATFLGRSTYSIRSLIWRNLLPVVKHDGSRKQWLDRKDLDLFIEKNKVSKQ